jgi:hypothetical protein
MTRTLLIAICLSIFLKSQSQNLSIKDKFLKKLDSCALTLETNNEFNSYKEIQLDTTLAIKYDYAILDTIQHCEIRYKIIPLTELNKLQKDTTIKMVTVGQDIIYKSALQALYFDISQNPNSLISYQGFPDQAVKNDFNADIGGQVVLESKTDFCKDCKKIYAISYYKKDKAIVFVFYLISNVDNSAMNAFSQLLINTYKVIKFKE